MGAKGPARITKNTPAKKALTAYVEALKSRNFKTWDELPEANEVRRQNPGLESLWKQYPDYQSKFCNHWANLVEEILGISKSSVYYVYS